MNYEMIDNVISFLSIDKRLSLSIPPRSLSVNNLKLPVHIVHDRSNFWQEHDLPVSFCWQIMISISHDNKWMSISIKKDPDKFLIASFIHSFDSALQNYTTQLLKMSIEHKSSRSKPMF